MTAPRNPFQYGRELSAEELVDRAEELVEIERTITNRGKLFLIGPRRFGKTSLLAAAEERAREQGVSVLRFDVEKYETHRVLAQALLSTAARQLEGSVDKVISLIREVAASLRPEITIDAASGNPHVSFGVVTSGRGELPLLSDALDSIEALARETGRETCIMLDEIQHIVVERNGRAAERQLRATVQRHRHLSYVFAGSSTRLLAEMTSDPSRPFYRLGARLFLGRIQRPDFLDFLEKGFAESGYGTGEGACDAILDLAEEVPYNVQRLAYESWEMLREEERPSLDPGLVQAALDRIVRKEDPAYTQLWNSFSRNQKKVVKAVIEMKGVNLHSAEVAELFSIPTSSIQASIKSLEAAHAIWRDEERGEQRYRLIDPFLPAWIGLAQAP